MNDRFVSTVTHSPTIAKPIGDMNHGAILNVRMRADPDWRNIAAQGTRRPDARLFTNGHISNHKRWER
jgi:hypothetical protein